MRGTALSYGGAERSTRAQRSSRREMGGCSWRALGRERVTQQAIGAARVELAAQEKPS